MVIVWRGAGILVPILLFVAGWIMSFWYDDYTMKNAPWFGQTLLYSGILILLLGLGMSGASDEEAKEAAEAGEAAPARSKHDFFWIPMSIWGLLFICFGTYTLIWGGESEPDYSSGVSDTEYVEGASDEAEDGEEMLDKRIINFYNPTDDSLRYLIADKYDWVEKKKVGPHSYEWGEYYDRGYLLAAFDLGSEKMISIPNDQYTDESLYETVEKDGSKYMQRLVGPATANKNDYDEVWLVMDGKHDLVLVDVSVTCTDTINKTEIRAINWEDKVVETYPGIELIEPLYRKKPSGDEKFTVYGPEESLPLELKENEIVYSLIPILRGEKITNEYLAEKIIEVCY